MFYGSVINLAVRVVLGGVEIDDERASEKVFGADEVAGESLGFAFDESLSNFLEVCGFFMDRAVA